MRVFSKSPRVFIISVIASFVLAACPLPYDYNGKGAAGNQTPDPSSPNVTSTAVVTATEQGGTPVTIADQGSFVSGKTTTVTLSTSTNNSVIYYTDDGSSLTNLSSAKRFNSSSGTITITKTTAVQSLDIHAIAVGPSMLPSLPIHVTVSVSPYPVVTITRDKASITEDGGTATFTVTSSSAAPPAGIPVIIQTSGGYDGSHVSFPVQAGSTFTATIQPGATTTTLGVTGVYNSDHVSQTVTLTIQPDSNNPPFYSVGTASGASVIVQDDGTYVVTYNGNGNTGGTAPTDANTHLPGATVTVLGPGSLVRTNYGFAGWADSNGTVYMPNQTFTMPSANVILSAQWTALPVAATPTFSPAGGVFATAQTVTISTTTPGATIRYTTDGTTPSETAGTLYSGSITVSSYTVLKAIAYESGFADSAIGTATYTILASFAGPWTLTNYDGTVVGVFEMVLIVADQYHFINNGGYVWSGVYQFQVNAQGIPQLVMIAPDNPNYTGFVWNVDSQTHLTLTNAGGGAPYAGSTCTR